MGQNKTYAGRFRRFGKAGVKTDNMEEETTLFACASCTFKLFSKILKKESVLHKVEHIFNLTLSSQAPPCVCLLCVKHSTAICAQ